MANPVLDSADVVVVGAGIAGIATAYELRERGYDVVVVEQRFPAYGASGRSAGSVWLQTCATGPELDLARAGLESYRRYATELGNTFGFRQNGGMFFFETEEQGAILEGYVRDRARAGLEIEMLDQAAARSRSSLLPATAIGAVFCADDAQVDAARFVRGLADASARRGVRIYENTSVLSTIRESEAVAGIRTTRGDVRTHALVWATGAWAVNLITEGIELPVQTARQGQILTQTVPPIDAPIMRGPRGVTWASALTNMEKYQPDAFGEPDPGATDLDRVRYDDTISQNGEGGLFIGSSIDAPGALNPHIGMSATNTMLTAALERYPQYEALGIVGLWAGVAAWTDDQLPIVDRVDGAWVNVAHARGIATGPVSGQVAAGLVSGEEPRVAASLRASRFVLA